MASNYVINAGINFRLNNASIKPVVDSFTKQISTKGISIPVNLSFKGINAQQVAKQSTAFRQLNASISSLSVSSAKASASLGSLYSRIRNIGNAIHSIGGNVNTFSNLNKQVVSLNQSIGQSGTSFKKAGAEAISFAESVGISARRFISFGIAAGVLAKVSYDFRNAVVAALEFDREMIRLKQVSGDSNEVIASIAKTISKLGTTLGVSSGDMAKTAVTLRQAGISARDTQKALESLGKTTLSPTFDSLASSTEGVIAIMKQFNTTAGELENQLSAISKVSAEFPVESNDLVEAIKRTGGAFKAAGGNLNELLALFTTIRGTTRESAESIATGMRTIIARLQDPAIAHKLHNIGVEVYDLKEQFVGPYEAIERLGAALRKLPSGDIRANSILKDIGGLRQLSRVIPLIYNPETTRSAYASAMNSAGTLSKDAVTAQEALLTQLNKVKEGFLDLFRVIATDSSVRTSLDYLIKSVQVLTDAMRQLKPLVPLFLGFAAVKGVSAIRGGFSSFTKGFGVPAKGYAKGGSVAATVDYSSGGNISGGTPGRDSVAALLMPGEFVLRKDAAAQIGYGNLTKLNSGSYRHKKLSSKYGFDTQYGDFASHLLGLQAGHKKKIYRTMGDYRLYKSPGYERHQVLAHKKHLRNLINEQRLIQNGITPTPFALGNVVDILKKQGIDKTPTMVYDSVADQFVPPQGFANGGIVGYAHGGLVGKDLTMDKLQAYLDHIGLDIKASDHINGVEHDPNLSKNFKGKFQAKNRKVLVGDNANIGTLLHEFGHALDFKNGKYQSNVAGTHQKIAQSYASLPGVEQTSLYGNGGLNQYQSHEQNREGFANAFASHALNKGLTKAEMQKNFPHLTAQKENNEVKKFLQSSSRKFSNILPQTQTASPPIKPPNKPPAPPVATPSSNNPANRQRSKGKINPPPHEPIQITDYGYGFSKKTTRNNDLLVPSRQANASSLFSPSTYKVSPSKITSTAPTKGIYDFVKDEQKQNSKKKNATTFAKQNNQRLEGLQKQYGNVTADINGLDKSGSKIFKAFDGWLQNSRKQAKNLDSKFRQSLSGLSPTQYNSMSKEDRQNHLAGRLGKAQFGLLAAGTLAPIATEHIFGNASKPGLGGESGARTGNAVGGALGGTAAGASIGGIAGPWGMAIGGLVGGLLGATGSLKQFDDELKEIQMKKFGESISKVQFNEKTGGFASAGDSEMFTKAIDELLPTQDQAKSNHKENTNYYSRIAEEYSNSGIGANLAGTVFGGNTTTSPEKHEAIAAMSEEQKKTLSDTAFNLFKNIATKNPSLNASQIMQKGDETFAQNKHGLSIADALTPEDAKAALNLADSLNKAAEVQKRMNGLLDSSNSKYQITISQLEKFSQSMQISGEQFSKRQHYSEMSSAPLQGQLMASPNDINLGALGGPETMTGQLHEFSKQGGGYDAARQQLLDLLQEEGSKKLTDLKPGEAEANDTRIASQIGKRFTAGGSYNSQIKEHLEGTLGQVQDLPDKIRQNPQAVVDQLLEKYKPIKETGEATNKQLQATYGEDQQRQVELMNRRFNLNQKKAESFQSEGEFVGSIREKQELSNPNSSLTQRFTGFSVPGTLSANKQSKAIGLSNVINQQLENGQTPNLSKHARSFLKKNNIKASFEGTVTSPEARALQASTREHQLAFQASRNLFAGSNLNVSELGTAYNKEDNKLGKLVTQRNAVAGGPDLKTVKGIQDKITSLKAQGNKINPVLGAEGVPQIKKQIQGLESQKSTLYKGAGADNLRKLDQQILSTEEKMRGYNQQLDLLKNNTTGLVDAQKKFEMAQQAVTADFESKKKDADVLAFGSQGEKTNLMQKENITQQALSASPEEFANMSDQVKKIVYERLNETQGMNRQVEQYDKYGRYQGQKNIESSQALEQFRKPYMDQLTNIDSSKALVNQRNAAGRNLIDAGGQQFQANQTQLGLQEKNLNKQDVQGADNFNKYLEGINQSIAQQMAATDKFLQGSSELTKALNGFQGKLQIERNGKLEVIVNGLAVMKGERDALENDVMQKVIEKLEGIINKKLKDQPVR